MVLLQKYWQKVNAFILFVIFSFKVIQTCNFKVWTDYKYNAKRKMSAKRKSMAKTGGGPYDVVALTPMEERVVAAASIEAQLAGVPNVSSFGAPASVEEPHSQMIVQPISPRPHYPPK